MSPEPAATQWRRYLHHKEAKILVIPCHKHPERDYRLQQSTPQTIEFNRQFSRTDTSGPQLRIYESTFKVEALYSEREQERTKNTIHSADPFPDASLPIFGSISAETVSHIL
jgi:hypothetical protein